MQVDTAVVAFLTAEMERNTKGCVRSSLGSLTDVRVGELTGNHQCRSMAGSFLRFADGRPVPAQSAESTAGRASASSVGCIEAHVPRQVESARCKIVL